MKKTKTPTPVITAILTLTTLFFWVGFEVYRSFTIKEAPPVPQEIINPIDPTLDTKSLDSIGQRLFLNDEQIGNTQISTPSAAPTPTTSPIPTSSPVASESATPTEIPSPTP